MSCKMEELEGKVTIKSFGKGSKSEHESVVLTTKNGEFVLRRQGANPFFDPEVRSLVGKTIKCEGVRSDYILYLSKWKVIS